jgi:hypothetical protein
VEVHGAMNLERKGALRFFEVDAPVYTSMYP